MSAEIDRSLEDRLDAIEQGQTAILGKLEVITERLSYEREARVRLEGQVEGRWREHLDAHDTADKRHGERHEAGHRAQEQAWAEHGREHDKVAVELDAAKRYRYALPISALAAALGAAAAIISATNGGTP